MGLAAQSISRFFEINKQERKRTFRPMLLPGIGLLILRLFVLFCVEIRRLI